MTDRLYYADSYLKEFEGRVLEVRDGAVRLDRTAFYPTSGGQPFDTGTLNGLAVTDVYADGAGEVWHRVEGLLSPGDRVAGAIDWARRFDHMQQHAGQHILSAAFQQALEAQTVSFHLGPETSTIDLDRQDLSIEALAEVEELANRVIMEGRAIEVAQYDEAAIQSVSLRKPPQVEGLIRVVSVPGFDYSACGGTHPRSCGEVGLVHIERWETHQGQARVTFLCGLRALRDYRRKSWIARGLASRCSVALEDLPAALDRLEAAADEARRQATRLRAQLLEWQVPALAAEATQVGEWRVVCRFLQETEAAEMRQLATQIVQAPGMVAVLGVERPSPQFCLARSADVALDMAALAAELAGPYGGRGGGRPHMAQGGGLPREGLIAMLQDAQERLAPSDEATQCKE